MVPHQHGSCKDHRLGTVFANLMKADYDEASEWADIRSFPLGQHQPIFILGITLK
jgi:hypothetical protein